MAENSKIEWTHHTFNPWVGCTKVSAGCQHCYAETLMDTRLHRVQWGPDGERVKTSPSYWLEPLRWDRQAAKNGTRYRVFCASLADVFEDRPELKPWRAALWVLINNTPHLDWLLLTKRPENVNRMIVDGTDGTTTPQEWFESFPNVWLGTSVENQAAADQRIPELLDIPAQTRFLSMEPLLGPVDIRKWLGPQSEGQWLNVVECGHQSNRYGVNWVIVGGESGPDARPMHPSWPRQLRDQCLAAGVPFLFKQWGEWQNGSHKDHLTRSVLTNGRVLHDLAAEATATEKQRWQQMAPTAMAKVGKAAAGRSLDGLTWTEYPAHPEGVTTP